MVTTYHVGLGNDFQPLFYTICYGWKRTKMATDLTYFEFLLALYNMQSLGIVPVGKDFF